MLPAPLTHMHRPTTPLNRGMFVPDVLFMFPFVPVILGACPGLIHTKQGLFVGLIGLLKLVSSCPLLGSGVQLWW